MTKTAEGLILTGFMGAGKSTVGPLAAERLGLGYYDTDEWMETEWGLDIPHLVKTDVGAFRTAEAQALDTVLSLEPAVISTGGGIVSTEIGRAALERVRLPVIWLDVTFDVARERVRGDDGRERPFYADIDEAQRRFEERQLWYRGTSNHIVNADLPVERVVEDIELIAKHRISQ